MLTADFGAEDNAALNGSNAKWRGVAGYLKYDCTDKFSLAGRAEVFGDPNGARTGTNQTLSEGTLTAQYKFRENLLGRLEYRSTGRTRTPSNAATTLRATRARSRRAC